MRFPPIKTEKREEKRKGIQLIQQCTGKVRQLCQHYKLVNHVCALSAQQQQHKKAICRFSFDLATHFHCLRNYSYFT